MTLKSIIYGTAAAALLSAAVPAVLPVGLDFAAPAQAQSSISLSVFYDDLAPHGDWVMYHDAYVFVPAGIEAGWRPYTEGRWVFTNEHGWLWVSDEPHGWATYHYGRWGFGDDIGWYWVPGTRWAPAWVSWRRSDDHVVWAPLPPDHDPDVFINVSYGGIPDYYWVAVPTRSFLSINIRVSLIDDDNHRRRILREAREDRRERRRDRIVNDFIDVGFIEERTGEKVPRRELRRSERRGGAKVGDKEVTVFQENVERRGEAKPKKVKKVEEVRRAGDGDQPTNRRKKAAEEVTGEQEGAPKVEPQRRKKIVVEQEDGEPAVKQQRRKKAAKQIVEPQRKKKVKVDGEATQRRADKRARQLMKAEQENRQKARAQRQKQRNAEQPPAQKKSRRGKVCDPQVNPDCPVQ